MWPGVGRRQCGLGEESGEKEACGRDVRGGKLVAGGEAGV